MAVRLRIPLVIGLLLLFILMEGVKPSLGKGSKKKLKKMQKQIEELEKTMNATGKRMGQMEDHFHFKIKKIEKEIEILKLKVCKDKNVMCKKIDLMGYCYNHKIFPALKQACEKTCNLCDVEQPENPPTPVKPGNSLGECGISVVSQSRVIGGTDAQHGKWPWQVGLYRGDEDYTFSCGGSLINRNWILTAASCISENLKVSDYRIRLGDWNRFYVDGTEQFRIASKIIKHEHYNQTSWLNNDIALIKLDRPVDLTSHVNTICLPEQGASMALNSECYITGWGKVKHPGGPYHKLQQAKLPLTSNDKCSEKLAEVFPEAHKHRVQITKQMVCAGDLDPSNSKGGCNGDGGGPFVCKNPASGKFFLEGAVSWGPGTCNVLEDGKFYSVFARVSEFRGWIDQKMASN